MGDVLPRKEQVSLIAAVHEFQLAIEDRIIWDCEQFIDYSNKIDRYLDGKVMSRPICPIFKTSTSFCVSCEFAHLATVPGSRNDCKHSP